MTDGRVTGARGILYVVATPIGNLGDITLRALEVLAGVPLIAAEDTRHTRRLLDRHAITTRMTSYHAQSDPARATALLDHLRGGADLALVTDAGRPAVSDPGGDLVAAWAAEGGAVVPVPGASAVLAAVAGSGLAGPRWSFEGFLPRSGRERRERLARIAADDRGTVVYEAPSRVAATAARPRRGVRPGAAGGRLPRADQAPRVDRPGDAGRAGGGRRAGWQRSRRVASSRSSIGAWLGARPADAADEASALAAAQAEVEALVAAGVARGDAARRVSLATGLPRRRLYRLDTPRLG